MSWWRKLFGGKVPQEPSAVPQKPSAVPQKPSAMTPAELLRRGLSAYDMRKFGEATSDLVEAMRLDKDLAEKSVLCAVGMAFGQDSCPREAFVFFTRAIELEPDDGDIYGFRARSLFGCSAYGAAIDDIDKAIELAPALRDKLSSLAEAIRKEAGRPRYSTSVSLSDLLSDTPGFEEKPMVCPSCFMSFPESKHGEPDGACKCPGCGYRIPLDLLSKKSISRKPRQTAHVPRSEDQGSDLDLDAAKRLGYCWDCGKPDPAGAYVQGRSGRRRCQACCSRLGSLIDQ